MTETSRNDNATGQGGEVGKAKAAKPKPIRKIDRIEAALRLPRGLNRFEAERIGDHTLNSTIAKLRERGVSINSRWETVPSFAGTETRVLRYWAFGAVGEAR